MVDGSPFVKVAGIMIQQFQNIEQASRAAVGHILKIVRAALPEKGFCTVVLAGGKTPQLTYQLMGAALKHERIPLQHLHFFWGDERWLPEDHPDSNFFMVSETLLARVPVPPQNIHRVHTGFANPDTGAEMYEKHLRNFFRERFQAANTGVAEDISVPRFDLILLGMGTDGHTASLFPGSDLLQEKKKWVAAVPHGLGSPPVARITLTLPVLNGAANILFLIAGGRKREILHTILTSPAEAENLYPAAHINPAGNLTWVVADEG